MRRPGWFFLDHPTNRPLPPPTAAWSLCGKAYQWSQAANPGRSRKSATYTLAARAPGGSRGSSPRGFSRRGTSPPTVSSTLSPPHSPPPIGEVYRTPGAYPLNSTSATTDTFVDVRRKLKHLISPPVATRGELVLFAGTRGRDKDEAVMAGLSLILHIAACRVGFADQNSQASGAMRVVNARCAHHVDAS